MADAYKSLTGRWLGRYDPPARLPPVAFEADLDDETGALTGETQEPNSFRRDLGPVLTATIAGTRTGDSVMFVKHYLQFRQPDPVYDGVVNAGLTRITGQWSFPGYPAMSGQFVMMRKPLATNGATRRARRTIPEEVG